MSYIENCVVQIPFGKVQPGKYVEYVADYFVGKFCKVSFATSGTTSELMWVKADHVSPDGYIVGTLDNDPYFAKYLRLGDTINFFPAEILDVDVMETPSNPVPVQSEGR